MRLRLLAIVAGGCVLLAGCSNVAVGVPAPAPRAAGSVRVSGTPFAQPTAAPVPERVLGEQAFAAPPPVIVVARPAAAISNTATVPPTPRERPRATPQTRPRPTARPTATSRAGPVSDATVVGLVGEGALRVKIDGVERTIWLSGVQFVRDGKHGVRSGNVLSPACSGEAVAQNLRAALAAGVSVRVKRDDHPGRQVSPLPNSFPAYVWTSGGELVNREIIRLGLARAARSIGDPYTREGELVAAQREAENAGVGLWQPGFCRGPVRNR